MTSGNLRAYAPTKAAQIAAICFTVPGILLFGWMGIKILSQGMWWGAIFIVGSVFLAIWTIFIATIRVTLNDRQLIRTWAFGSCVIPVAEITKLTLSGGRTLFLVIRAREKRMMLSTQSFKKLALHEISNAILAARGLEGQPPLPPKANYIDVEEMTLRYLGRNGDQG